MENPLISVVIPIYNEEQLIENLFERTISSLTDITDQFEVICVDDGSTDGSLDKLIECHSRDKRLKVLVLSRNFGHQSAFTAGLGYAKGDFIAMMDGDLQDPPELLKEMYEKLANEGCQIVYGKRTGRKEKFQRKIFIKLFHVIFNRFSSTGMDSEVGNFSMFNKQSLDVLLSLTERSRYLPGLRSYIGFNQDYVEYPRSERAMGEPKMDIWKLINLSFDAIFSFTDFPIKMCIYTGLFGLFLFFLAIVYTFISKLTGIAPLGWSSTLLSIYFLGSIQLLFLGIIGEYIARIYKESLGRPIYVVKKFIE